jgi:hypothetical protein
MDEDGDDGVDINEFKKWLDKQVKQPRVIFSFVLLMSNQQLDGRVYLSFTKMARNCCKKWIWMEMADCSSQS